MAAIMLSKSQRDSYLELANMWRKLADQAGKHRARVEAWTRKTGGAPAEVSEPAGSRVGREPVMDAD